MKTLTLSLCLIACSLKSLAQLIVEYNFDSSCNNLGCGDNCHGVGVSLPSYFDNSVLLSVGSFDLGPGLNGAGTVCGFSNMNGFAAGQPGNPNRARWASGWQSSFSIDDCFSFSLSAQPLVVVLIDSMTWKERRSSDGPTTREVRISSDFFTSVLWTETSISTSWVKKKVVSGFPTFSSGGLEVRLCGYGSSSSAGSLRVDSLQVYAHMILTLPVELMRFEATRRLRDVYLEWVTGSENNNLGFEVQKSLNLQNWDLVGWVDGTGHSFLETNYRFIDKEPSLLQVSYYRLVQIDFDGTRSISQVLAVNPSDLVDEMFQVFDLSGKFIREVRAEEISSFVLPPGLYFVRDRSGRAIRRLVF